VIRFIDRRECETHRSNRRPKTLRDLRVAEIVELDMQLDAKGNRAKVNISFKFEGL
jgi:hypothetical protein